MYLNDICQLVTTDSKFENISRNPYMTIDESYELLLKWLPFQFDEDANEPATFVKMLALGLDWALDKINCLYLTGPPNCGKSLVITF